MNLARYAITLSLVIAGFLVYLSQLLLGQIHLDAHGIIIIILGVVLIGGAFVYEFRNRRLHGK